MIPHNRPTLGQAEQQAAGRVLESGWVAQGEEVAAFETEFGSFLDVDPARCVAVSSGSSALYLAIVAAGITSPRVAAPAYSCRALWNAIHLAEGQAIWRDTASSSNPNSGAEPANSDADIVISAHMFGLPAGVSREAGRVVIEDCAQALGATVHGRKVGADADFAIFSFGATKLITSGGHGGMVVARDREKAARVRDLVDYDTPMDHLRRFNFQMTDLEAAVGRAQLARLPELLDRRAAIYARYGAAGIPLLDSDVDGAQPVRFRAVVPTQDAEKLQAALAEAGVRAIVPVTEDELLTDSLPNALALARSTLSLPVFPSLMDLEVDLIASTTCRTLNL